MRNPSDICRHDHQLYVADENYCIWRVSADDHSYITWLPTQSTTDTFPSWSLSVTSQGLLVTSWDPPCLREYSMTDRQLLRVVKLSWNMKDLFHGVETTRGTFVICHLGTTQYEWQSAVSCHHNFNTLVLMHFNYIYHSLHFTFYTNNICTIVRVIRV